MFSLLELCVYGHWNGMWWPNKDMNSEKYSSNKQQPSKRNMQRWRRRRRYLKRISLEKKWRQFQYRLPLPPIQPLCIHKLLQKLHHHHLKQILSTFSIQSFGVQLPNFTPSTTAPLFMSWLGLSIPYFVAMALVMKPLSPVIILMFTPAN